MCLARTGGRGRFVRVPLKSKRSMRATPRNWPRKNSAKRSRYATGRFMPTGSRSSPPIFHHDLISLRRRDRQALDGLNVAGEQAAGLIDVATSQRLKNQAVVLIG